MISFISILVLCAALIIVVYEDFRFRMIHIWVFPMLFVSMVMIEFSEFLWEHLIFNLSFLLLQFILLTLWFSIKASKLIWITKQHLGSGDLIFWLCLSGLFSPVNFTFFFLISLVVSLLLAVIFRMNGTVKIPLAGFQGLALLGLILFFYLQFHSTSFRNDTPILNLLLS